MNEPPTVHVIEHLHVPPGSDAEDLATMERVMASIEHDKFFTWDKTMRMRKGWLVGLVVLAACARDGPTASARAVDGVTDEEIEIAAVSAASLTDEQRGILDLCFAFDFGLDQVAGMGLIPHARDLPHYVRLHGVEPEAQTDDPAWAIVFDGEIDVRGTKMTDATCVVYGGAERYFYATGPMTSRDGSTATPMPVPGGGPDRQLPPLAFPPAVAETVEAQEVFSMPTFLVVLLVLAVVLTVSVVAFRRR